MYFDHPILAQVTQLRVFDLDGFGVKIENCWDCLFENISVEQCGNADNYAFSMNDGGDKCNMSHILRLQVDKASQKAIYISGSTLSCVIDNIHSEGAIAAEGIETWVLRGSRCQYNAGRFAATVPAEAEPLTAILHLVPGDSHFHTFLVENVDVEGTSEVDRVGAINTLVDTGTDGTVNSFNGFEVRGTLSIGTTPSYDPKIFQFNNGKIVKLTSSHSYAAATFTNCVIDEGGNLLTNTTLLNTQVTGASAIAHSMTGTLRMIDSKIIGALTYTNHSPIRMAGRSQISGTVACGDAGAVDILADLGCTVGGSSSSIGVPTNGAHIVGDYHTALLPAVGQPKGWMCTVAGTPGTFISIGNL